MELNNEKQKYRKCQNMLSFAGNALVLLGVWDVIQVVLNTFMMVEEIEDLKGLLRDTAVPIGVIACAVAISLMIDLLIRVLIGMNAVAEAKGRVRKKGRRAGQLPGYAYMVWCIIFMIFYILVEVVMWYMSGWDYIFNYEIRNVIMSLVSVGIMVLLVVNVIRIKQFRRKGML